MSRTCLISFYEIIFDVDYAITLFLLIINVPGNDTKEASVYFSFLLSTSMLIFMHSYILKNIS